jgi:hypothetical protein
MRKFFAWACSLIAAMLMLMSITEGWAVPALLALASVAACWPTIWNKIELDRPTYPRARLTIGAILMAWSMVSWNERFNLTPEGKKMLAEQAAAEAKELAKQTAAEKAIAEEEIEAAIAGKHCASGWDGSVRPFKTLVEQSMRNPSSFEHIGTVIGDRDNQGNHQVVMRFRAENGFGGMNVEHATAMISSADCHIISWQMSQ